MDHNVQQDKTCRPLRMGNLHQQERKHGGTDSRKTRQQFQLQQFQNQKFKLKTMNGVCKRWKQ